MNHEVRRIPLEQIDVHDHAFRLLPAGVADPPPDDLKESIRRFGILQPPILMARDTDRYAVVAGRRRLAAADGRDPAPWCRILPASTSTVEALLIAYEDDRFHRGETPLRRAMLVAGLEKLLDWQELARTILPRLGLPPHRQAVDRLRALVELEPPILQALHDGVLDGKVAEELTELSMRDRLAIYDCIANLRPSVGNQRKLVAGCRQLARRLKTSIMAILAADEPQAILNHPTATASQKTAKLMAWLTRQRFPRLSAAEEEFNRRVQALHLPDTVRLHHAPAFERDTVTMEITFADLDAASRAWEALRPLL